MTDIKNLLNGVHKIKKPESAQAVFYNIAKQLFQHYYIEQGDVKYLFLEIEFYYHSRVHPDHIKVYDRKCDEAGKFLIHSSGVDICFENKDEAYGGILLRHLLRIDKDGNRSVVAGPWDCCLALFNYTDKDNAPILRWQEKTDYMAEVKETTRYNAGDTAATKYCFYNKAYHNQENDHWTIDCRYDPIMKNHNKRPYLSICPWKQSHR